MDIEILQTSFDSLNHDELNFTRRFYQTLLARYPEFHALFGKSVSERQHVMLYQALAAIMDHLDDAYWLKNALAKYGARHAQYGVTSEMFDRFGECLIATLAEVKGERWSAEIEQAWRDAYTAISRMMQVGERERPE